MLRELIAENRPFSTGALMRRAGITKQGASYHLVQSVRTGELVRFGAGRGSLYAPRQSIPSLLTRLYRDRSTTFTNYVPQATTSHAPTAAGRYYGRVRRDSIPMSSTA